MLQERGTETKMAKEHGNQNPVQSLTKSVHLVAHSRVRQSGIRQSRWSRLSTVRQSGFRQNGVRQSRWSRVKQSRVRQSRVRQSGQSRVRQSRLAEWS